MTETNPSVAYFSMEIALADAIPTYSGGLGVLAGDHLRAAADLGLPIRGITLLHRAGYFHQAIEEGRQREEPVKWSPESHLERLGIRASVMISGREVAFTVWRYTIRGVTDREVPVDLLDVDLPENDPVDRLIAGQLYGGDHRDRLRQEALLGLGGLALLEQLGERPTRFHMNEGHSSLLTYGLVKEAAQHRPLPDKVAENWTLEHCAFTTHTPVPAGHDVFDQETVREVLGEEAVADLAAIHALRDGKLNMTDLGMGLSGFVNAVSLRHGDLSREMFPQVQVRSITNGVHAPTWVAPSLTVLFDRHLPGWQRENSTMRYATSIPLDELRAARHEAKVRMIDLVAARTGVTLAPDALTLGLARRATAYKRNDLLLSDPERLAAIAESVGPLQVVFSGKAHPKDLDGKAMILRVHEVARMLEGRVTIVFVPDYSLELAGAICAGSDVWVNTPTRPHEASGTSGMKAALNGVPSLSILDGWWIEGHLEGVTGWSIGTGDEARDDAADAADLYAKLEGVIGPMYFHDTDAFVEVGRGAIALNGSYFNTERMVREYATFAYDLDPSL